VERAAVVMLTANRGLAGAFNANLIRETRQLLTRLRGEGAQVEFHAVGKKGISFFRFQREEMASSRADITDRPTAEDAESLINPLMERFVAGELDAVYVVYAKFNSALSTPPTSQQVLPIPTPEAARRVRTSSTSWSRRRTRFSRRSCRSTCATRSTARSWRPRRRSRARAAPR
jgi:F-type H+-transporting ATPase subunit gamma